MAAAGRRSRRSGRPRRSRPAVMMQTRSAILRTIVRSWVISSSAMPSRSRRSFIRLQDVRLDRHVERGRRLVGDQDVGLVGDRHRDHHPLALAARELVRIGAEPVLGVAQTDQPQEFDRALARRAAAMCLWISKVSAICFSSVCSGFSEVIGSWKTIAIRLPRTWRSRAGAAPTSSSPAKRMLLSAPVRRRGRAGAAGSTTRSPTCPSRFRRPTPGSRRGRG